MPELQRVQRALPTAILLLALSACGGSGTPAAQVELSERELAWCVARPGAVGDWAADNDMAQSAAAQRVVDEGIYDDADRWEYHDGWDAGDYARVCSAAYAQMGGADDNVDLEILEPEARVAAPAPTANLSTANIRERATSLVPQLTEVGAELSAALRTPTNQEQLRAAAEAVRAITAPEEDDLSGAVAESCYEDAGAAYGMTVFSWSAAASNALRYLDEGPDDNLLYLANDWATDAIEYAEEWRRLDRAAC